MGALCFVLVLVFALLPQRFWVFLKGEKMLLTVKLFASIILSNNSKEGVSMKNINVPIEDDRHEDLLLIQEYYSGLMGVKLSQAQTLKRLLFEKANEIRRKGGKEDACK
uniref:Uncharacterized protein n=1 Tax=uncultured prokaryote TaxID=198431 RepID=A0A0H5QPY2_9ZZZZ|nr:hypothetical protein [uncultured prokaryote]